MQEAELPGLRKLGVLSELLVLSELVLLVLSEPELPGPELRGPLLSGFPPNLNLNQVLGQVQTVGRPETNLGPALQTPRAEPFHQSCFAKTLWLRGFVQNTLLTFVFFADPPNHRPTAFQ